MITTFGEIMLRISPMDSGERIIQAQNFTVRPGGSEANVAVALAHLGMKAAFVSCIPDNALGEKILKQLKAENIETGFMRMSSDRVGVYWSETGIGPRNSFVIYDRENSAFSKTQFEDFQWSEILDQSSWFHFSGISPALNENVYLQIERITEVCSIPYSVDLNFRSKLWDWVSKDPAKISALMKKLCIKATLLAGNETDFQNVFGFNGHGNNPDEVYMQIAEKCFSEFTNLKYLAISHRASESATLNKWSGSLYVKVDRISCYKGVTYTLDSIRDRLGTGDAFVAGIIYGLHQEVIDFQETIDFAVALSALKHTINGDFSSFSKEDVVHVMKTKGSGKIVR